jgi:acyl-CoA thioesterase II
MGDFDVDTAVTGGDGHYRATLSADWEIWGPNGGYVAAVALRAAGAESRFKRPASYSGSFLSVARFEPVDLRVEVLRASKTADVLRVSMTQDDRAIHEAMVWTVAEIGGLEHDDAPMPDVPPPAELASGDELRREVQRPTIFRFWDNIEDRPLDWVANWEEREPDEPISRGWMRFRPRATFDDPFVDAARSLLFVDTMGWPAAARAHRAPLAYIAPNIDVNVAFHRLEPTTEWLYVEATAPVAADALIGFRTRVWSETGRVVASGGGQLLCRPVPRHLQY